MGLRKCASIISDVCGIAGIIDFGQRAPTREQIVAMTRTLGHRGPDFQDTWVEGPAALGHTRLSIIDLSSAANQPFQAGDHVITYNGELYNYRELRRELGDRRFVTESDTEVALASLVSGGAAALRRWNGMFAFGLWSRSSEKLLLARDRFGIKPLYYTVRDGRLAFASEIKALLTEASLPRTTDFQALHEYLYYGNSLGPLTMFREIRELPPGHFLEFGRSGLAVHRYFVPGEDLEPILDTAVALAEVRAVLERAVERHLVADVPVGVLLSGGIDSSAITAFAAPRVDRLKTFSVSFDFDRSRSELPLARVVAQRFATDHTEISMTAQNLLGTLERLLEAHDEPFADAANLPLYLVTKELRGNMKVVLQGDGGDEMFAGYRRYAWLRHAKTLRPLLRLAGKAGRSVPRLERWSRFAAALANPSPALQMAYLLTVETASDPPTRILQAEVRAHLADTDPFLRYRECAAAFHQLDPVQRQLYTDSSILLPNTFLEKVDRSTMANGVEVRVPFLDVELSDLAFSIDSRIKVRGGTQKWLLRQALRGLLPDEVIDAPKRGFGVPVSRWLRHELASDMQAILLDPAVTLFDRAELERVIGGHLSGRHDHGVLLYKAMQLALWARRYRAIA